MYHNLKIKEISVNVFGHEKDKVYPLHLTKKRFMRLVDHLVISSGKRSYFCWIKQFQQFDEQWSALQPTILLLLLFAWFMEKEIAEQSHALLSNSRDSKNRDTFGGKQVAEILRCLQTT